MKRYFLFLLFTIIACINNIVDANPLELQDNKHKIVLSYQGNRITLLEVGSQGELDTIISITHEEEIKKVQVLPDKKSFYVLHQDQEGTFKGGQTVYSYVDVTTMYRYEEGYIIRVFKKRYVNLLGHIIFKEYIIRENGLIYTIDDEFVQSKYPVTSLFAMRAKTSYNNLPDSTYQRLKQGKTYGTSNEIYTVLKVVDNETKIIVEKKTEATKKGGEILLLELNPDFVIGNELGKVDFKANHINIAWSYKTKTFYYSEEDNVPSTVHYASWANNTLAELGKHPTKLHNLVVNEANNFLMGIDKKYSLQFFILDDKGVPALTSSFSCKEESMSTAVLSEFIVVSYKNGVNVILGFGKPHKEANEMWYYNAILNTTGESSSWKAHQFSYIDKKNIQFMDIEAN